ncbi:hypothetical protein [Rhodanobacter sp. B04]|uniref:hypothetical protein n=1 Tax=Rhodanobacter sp. B04 TaxID=1945860 RepID=UPI0011158E10|nr:hypothetical protein [Rhodanobacter sp. B04]
MSGIGAVAAGGGLSGDAHSIAVRHSASGAVGALCANTNADSTVARATSSMYTLDFSMQFTLGEIAPGKQQDVDWRV